MQVHQNGNKVDILRQNGSGDFDSPFDSLDINKVRQVFRKSLPWIILCIVLSLSCAFFYLRYTKPVFSSESVLKLDIKSESGLLGIQNPLEQDIKGLAGEIEILRSRLFLGQVVEALDLDISYYHPGRSYLVDERYGNSPFNVSFDFIRPELMDQRVMVEIISDDAYRIEVPGLEPFEARFGEKIVRDQFIWILTKTKFFESQKEQKRFFFIVNSQEALIDYLEKNISVQPVNFNANTVMISFSDHNLHKAKTMVEAIDTVYLVYTKKVKNQASEQKIAFLENQMAKTAAELENFEEYFEQFTIKNRTTDLSADLSNTILALNQLDSQRFNIRNQLSAIGGLLKELEQDVPLTITDVPKALQSQVTEYNELIKERELKLDNYNENTQVIARINRSLSIAKESARNSMLQYEENLHKSRDEIKDKRSMLESSFVELPSMGTSYNKNMRLYSLQEEFYFSLIKTKIELEIAKAGTVTNFYILKPATMPINPIHPKKVMIYGIGVVAGIVLSLIIIALSYVLHDKVTNEKELERNLPVPLLGIVPKYVKEKLELTKLIVNSSPRSPISEALRTIRTNMEFMASDDKIKVISVTSTVSGEGKTFVGVNLAAICAYSGQKVVVVDLDLRKPKIHIAFEAERQPKGVSTILIGKHAVDECLQQSEVDNLQFIQSGPTPPNPSELILSNHFNDFLEELKSKFDLIIIDTPPVGLVTDGILVMRKTDLPVYVVRAEYSKLSYLKTIRRLVLTNKFNHLSVVLNGMRARGVYGYGYGYSDYSDYYDDSRVKRKLKKVFKKS